MSTRSRHYWWLYLAAGAILCGLYVFKAPFQGSGPVINGLGLYGVIGVVGGIRVHKPVGLDRVVVHGRRPGRCS